LPRLFGLSYVGDAVFLDNGLVFRIGFGEIGDAGLIIRGEIIALLDGGVIGGIQRRPQGVQAGIIDSTHRHSLTIIGVVALLEGFEVNFQTVIYGEGTAGSRLEYVGLSERDKAVILSVIREDMVKRACEMLEERFARVKNGRGIAFTVPFKSVMGVHSYCFLSNTKSEKKGG
jgi:hypothetical protein